MLYFITASLKFTHIVGTEQSLILQCLTAALNDTILFKLDNINKGGCTTRGACTTGISGYETPERKGTTITEMVITLCNKTRDIGSWTCSYGGSTSDPDTIIDCEYVCPCYD